MALIVQKYGGSSVGTADKMRNVAKRIIKTKQEGNDLVVVVSAMGKTTDEMIAKMKSFVSIPDAREYDQFISTGENISASLLAMMLQSLGEKAVSLTGFQAGVFTEDIPSKAKILTIDPSRIQREIAAGKVVVITGFQGYNSKGDITTIGRSGSDSSAVAIAVGLNADRCDIFTDVDGVYSTDPRAVPEAVKVESLSHEEMLEMASLGAGVLHPRAVEIGKNHNLDIMVRNSHNEEPGTIVTQQKIERGDAVTGIAADEGCAKLSVLKVRDIPGMAAKLFGSLANASINVDMIVQGTHEEEGVNDISFTVPEDDLDRALQVCREAFPEMAPGNIFGAREVAKISIIGVGMISTPGIAARMFQVLARENINIDMISTSEIKVSCIIKKENIQKAVKMLHKEFIEVA